MAQASEITGYVSTATGLCLNSSDFAPAWVILQTILFLISTGIAVFDTYSDWVVVLNFKEFGFNHPLLGQNDHWLRAWFLFASIGTILTTISALHDLTVLLHSMYQSCKKHCCKSCCKLPSRSSKDIDNIDSVYIIYGEDLEYELNSTESNQKTKNTAADNEKGGKKDDEDDDSVVDDPFKSCYRCGCNVVTRNETLGIISLWFQDVPMLTIAVLYAFSQSSCKTPEVRDVTPVLRNIGISAIAACLAALWRTVRSFIRLYSSVGVRMKSDKKCIKKCLPKKRDVVYPPDTRAQFCVFGFYFGLLMQISALFMAFIITCAIWLNFRTLSLQSNFDDSLGIYRFSVDHPDVRLFNLSGSIIEPNGTFTDNNTFVNFEQIPERELDTVAFDVFCLSEFEYRRERSQIFFNSIEIVVVSNDGRFCDIVSGTAESDTNYCDLFYTFRNFVLYYASVSATTGQILHFDDQCTAIFSHDRSGPLTDFSIDVARHINRTSFPENDDAPLVVIYPPPNNLYVNVSSRFSVQVFQDPESNSSCLCFTEFQIYYGRVNFNFIDLYVLEAGGTQCICSLSPGPICRRFHRNLSYGYLSQDGNVVPYTQCSQIPPEKLVPHHDPTLDVSCPCDSV